MERGETELSEDAQRAVRAPEGGASGFTIVELLIAIIMATVLLSVVYGGYRQFNEAMIAKKAASLLGADVALTRSYAIQKRSNVSLVADETARDYAIRDASGTVLARRSFDNESDLPLDRFDVKADGDSLTFNARGLMAGGGGVEIDVGRGDRLRTLTVNALGRYQVETRQ